MIFINFFIIFIFGTIIGSFLNVLVLRYGTSLSIVHGCSRCFSCSKELHWYELIPLFSFMMLGGKCLGCNSKISYQYPLVEFITGLIFLGTFWVIGLTPILPIYLLTVSVLIAMAVYDFKHKIIPDGMVFVFSILALIILFIKNGASFQILFSNGLLDLLAGPILFLFFATLWFMGRGKWMGFGDAKLALGVGWMLGFSGGIFAIILAFWIGAAVSLIILGLEKLKLSKLKLSFKSEIPFAPFIILSLFIQLMTTWSLHNIIYFLN